MKSDVSLDKKEKSFVTKKTATLKTHIKVERKFPSFLSVLKLKKKIFSPCSDMHFIVSKHFYASTIEIIIYTVNLNPKN